MPCKGLCQYYKALKPQKVEDVMLWVKNGVRPVVFILMERSRCPCCGNRIRSKPRNRKFKLDFERTNKNTKFKS